MADDDDDVIFEGRELQKYLNEIGYKDFEVASPNESLPTSPREAVNSFYRSASDWLRRPWISDVKPMDHMVLCKHIELILECGLIFEDDVHFVKNVLPSSQTENQIANKRTLNSEVLNLPSPFNWLTHSLGNEVIWPVTGSLMFCALWSWRKTRQNAQNLVHQKNLLQAMKDLYVVFWKSMKLLQENELILRGFTLAKTGSTVSRLENSDLPCMIRKWDSSPGLRIAVAKTLVEAITTLSCATQQLISYCPLFGQLDNPSHYMSYLDEKTLGLLQEEEELGVKLSHLKVYENVYLFLQRLHHVFLLLQSEFLRRLALCFCPELWRWQSLKQVKNVMQTVCNVTKTASHIHSNLIKEYQIFYSYGTCEKIQDNALLLPIQKSDFFKTTDLQDAIRSASLHLQVLLLNTRTLEERLEIKEQTVQENEDLEDVITHLSSIIQELDACRSCCEEGIIQIKKLTTLEALPEPEGSERIIDKIDSSDAPLKVVQVGYTDLDPQVEDEVFEAVITEDIDSESTVSYNEDVIKNEQMQYEKAKQLSKKMMQELKSVLVIKAQKWKEREAKALLAKQTSPELSPNNDRSSVISVATASCSAVMVATTSATQTSTIATTLISASTATTSTCVSPTISFNTDQGKNEIPSKSISEMKYGQPVDKVSQVLHTKPKSSSLHSSPRRKESPQHKLIHGYAGSECSLERCADSPVSNAFSSSSSQTISGRSPKHVYASETFRPLQNDLQFSVGLHLSNDALAKFQARNLGGSDTFSGTGEKSSSEESLVEDQ
ncbi:Uncharacterized protein GBIM_10699 [Gryllus bimaculatus]|nr:Uncharacterized protein GBIM_10699 [Gryllus bimaculatus]